MRAYVNNNFHVFLTKIEEVFGMFHKYLEKEEKNKGYRGKNKSLCGYPLYARAKNYASGV